MPLSRLCVFAGCSTRTVCTFYQAVPCLRARFMYAEGRMLLVTNEGLMVVLSAMRAFPTSEMVQSRSVVVLRAISRNPGQFAWTYNYCRLVL